MKKVLLCPIVFVIIFLCATGAHGLEVRLIGDKLMVHADQVPLQSILQRFADIGVKIRIDPEINPKITASFEDRDVRRGLDSILKPFDHVLIWQSIEGPAGPIPKLAEIQVFKPGKKDLMKAFGTRAGFSVARDPKDGSFYIKNEILLGLMPGISLSEFKRLLKEIGGTVVDSHTAVGVYRIRLPKGSDVPSLVEQITRHPKVAKAEANYAYPLPDPDKQTASSLSTSDSSNVPAPGEAAPIAILDSGLSPSSGLEDAVLASLDALTPDEPISDSLGHGTQMALIATGVVKPSGVGANSEAHSPIIPIRIFDDNGFTSSFTIMNSVDFALKHGARVMSLSWGSETRSDFLESALNYARSEGLIIVASAGNEPTGKSVYPAAYPSVIGVGALGPDGKSWEKSNYGDFVTLYAPGFASLPVGYNGDPGAYAGTSISAAFVANVISNYIAEHPDATMQQVLDFLGGR